MPATKACAESGRRPAHFALGLQSGEAKARRRRLREFRRHRYRTFLLQAHDPPKYERFGDNIMRQFNVLESALGSIRLPRRNFLAPIKPDAMCIRRNGGLRECRRAQRKDCLFRTPHTTRPPPPAPPLIRT